MSRQELTIIDDEDEYYFTIAPRIDSENDARGKLYMIQTKNWEPADGTVPFRRALHPWSSGLGPNRLDPSVTFGGDLKNRPSMVYAKGNLDASWPGFVTFPPHFTVLDSDINTTLSSYYNSAVELTYGGSSYGTVTYMGAADSLGEIALAVRNFNNKAYFAGGQYLFAIDPNHDELRLVKNFGSGNRIFDFESFNDELVFAMGETTKIWTMDKDETFTQASDSTYAIALGRTNELLWRAESINKISNCITAPRTLTSWTPTSPNQYSAGDTTYSITEFKEYGGSIVAIKPDGAYLADGESIFHNQTPDLLTYPHIDNGKGSFNAWGYLWIPSVVGLIRMTIGEAPVVGPELSLRPDFRFHVKSGVAWNGSIYLLCYDAQEEEQLFICKMDRDKTSNSNNPYVYHEWCRLGTTDSGSVAIVYTGAINPINPILIVGRGQGLALITLGHGSGPAIDDENYKYGEELIIEPGLSIASEDLGIKFDLVGMKLVAKQVEDGTITLYHDVDNTGTWEPLTSTVDGSGITAIYESGWLSEKRYANPNTATGHALYTKLVATMPEEQFGTDRTEIYEWWVFGNAHPETTEIITVDLYSDIKARVRGLIQGRRHNNFRLLRDLALSNRTIEMKLPDYDTDQTVRVQIQEIAENNVSLRQSGQAHIPSNVTRIIFRRVDYSGDLDG